MDVKKIIFLSICCILSLSAFSQGARGNYNFLDFQQKPFYFGATFGYTNSNYKLKFSKDFILNDSIRLSNSVKGPGFNVGIVSNMKVGRFVDLRFLPTLSFVERNISYATPKDFRPKYTRKLSPVLVELPFQVRYKSVPFNDMRVFVVGGIKYSFDLASNTKRRHSEGLVQIAPTDFQIEYGAGAQFFLPFFIFSPEIKMSHGLSNGLIYNDDINEAKIIDKVLSRAFTISFHLEG